MVPGRLGAGRLGRAGTGGGAALKKRGGQDGPNEDCQKTRRKPIENHGKP